MYDINEAYANALQEAKIEALNEALNEAVTIDDNMYEAIMNRFKTNPDVVYGFIGQQILETIDDYSDYITDNSNINTKQLEELATKIYESNATDYIKNYINNIVVGQLEQLNLINDEAKQQYNKDNKLNKNQIIDQYVDRFQNAINKQEMYKVIDEAYYDTRLSGKEFQRMINEDFKDIIEDNFNIEMDNKDGLTVYQQIIQHKF